MYQTISKLDLVTAIVNTQKIHNYPEIEKHMIENFMLRDNHFIAEYYSDCTGTVIFPVMSNLFMFKN